MLLCAASVWSAPAGGAEQPALDVAAAASLAEALGEIAAAWRAAPGGGEVRLQLAASNVLARQIAHGAPVDVFVSADEAQMEALATAGLLRAGSRIDLLSNTLVVVVPSASARRVAALRDLLSPAVRRVAMGDPEAVPAGVYARRYLESQGLWEAVAPRVVAAESVRGALGAVASGNADAGWVYRTDALAEPRVRLALEVPAASGPPIVYPAAVIAASPRPETARMFLDYLRGAAASEIFRRHGFGVLAATAR